MATYTLDGDEVTEARRMMAQIHRQMVDLRARWREFVPYWRLAEADASPADATPDWHARMAALEAEHQKWCDVEDAELAAAAAAAQQ